MLLRIRKQSEIKQLKYMNRICVVHNIVKRSINDVMIGPQLVMLIEKIDDLHMAFNVEDEAILDHFFELDLEYEHSDAFRFEMLELVFFATATTNRFHEIGPKRSSVFKHGGSYMSVTKGTDGETLPDKSTFVTPTFVTFDKGVSVLDSMNLPNLGVCILFSLAFRYLLTYRIKLFEK